MSGTLSPVLAAWCLVVPGVLMWPQGLLIAAAFMLLPMASIWFG